MNRVCGLALVLVLLMPVAARAAGLPVAKKTVTIKNTDVEISIEYPQTRNKVIDATVFSYVKASVAQFEATAVDRRANEDPYTLETTYKIERNDGKLFAVVFGEYTFTGGAHPNSNTVTFNFLLPDGAQVFLPEIVDGARGVARVSRLAIATLVRTVGGGTEALTTKDMIVSGAGPLADNFKAFVWLPSELHIYFPPYQVAAYAAGPQEATIPLAQLKDDIRADWRAPAPSFDCRVASGTIEITICTDSALARLDRQVYEIGQIQLDSLSTTSEMQKLMQAQRDWIALRDKRCVGAAPAPCLKKIYDGRLAALRRAPYRVQ